MYKEGKLKKDDMRYVLNEANKKGELTRDDLRHVVGQAYKEGQLTRGDVRYLVTEAYKAGELKRQDVAWIISQAYKNKQLSREDMKAIVMEAYKAGELRRDDVREVVIVAYKQGRLSRDDVKYMLMEAYKNRELTREDVRKLLTAAYNHGELTRADIKWLIVQAYKAGELKKEDVKWILIEAIKRGELRRADVLWLVREAHKAGELTASDISEADVTQAQVEVEPADVPSVEEITEPNADNAVEATGGETFDESKTAAPADSVVKTKQAMMLYKYAFIHIEKHRVGMEALIGYVESIGKDATKLKELKDKFVSLADQLKTAAESGDYQGGKKIVGQMKDTVASFKAEVKVQVAGSEAGAKDALNAALEQNSDYFDQLVTESREAKKDRNLELFDLVNARAQGRLDKAVEKGADVSALQAKLDEIKELRSALVESMDAGIASCQGEGLGKCTTPEAASYKQLREDIKKKYREIADLAKTVGLAKRVQGAITKAREIIAGGEKFLDGAEARGVDVSAERTALADIKSLVDSAEAKAKAGNIKGATDELKQAQEKFKSLKNDAASRRRPK